MRTTWSDGDVAKAVTAPVSLIVSAFAPVPDARRVLTPLLRIDDGETALLLDRLSARRAPARRLGACAGVRAARQRERPTSTIRHRSRRSSRRSRRLHARRSPARLSRHRGWRPLRDARGNGVCVALRPRHRIASTGTDALCRALRRRAGCGGRRCVPADVATSSARRLAEQGLVVRCDRCRDGRRPHPDPPFRRRRCSTNRASISIAPGRRRRTRCSGCATIRTTPTRSTTRILDAARSRALAAS